MISMTGVHVYDPSDSITYRHMAPLVIPDDAPTSHFPMVPDRLTGDEVYTLPARDLRIGGLLLPGY